MKYQSSLIRNILRTLLLLGLFLSALFNAAYSATCADPCLTTLYQGGHESRGIDIVYVPVGYDMNSSLWSSNYIFRVNESMGFINKSPFNQYPSYFNVHRLDITASLNETSQAYALAVQYAPNVDLVIFLRAETGRASASLGGDVTLYSSDNSVETTTHELGHAIGYLGDEYVELSKCSGGSSGVYIGGESGNANLTINTDLTTLKWKEWLSSNGGTLGTPVEGGGYCATGIWRPVSNSVMRSGNAFDPVGREAMIRRFSQKINPIVSRNPSSNILRKPTTQFIQLRGELDPNILPQSASPEIQWYASYDFPFIDPGSPIPGATTDTLVFDLTNIPPGKNATVWMGVFDPDINDYVRLPGSITIPITPDGKISIGTGTEALWTISETVPPTISDLNPLEGWVGSSIYINGTNFCINQCQTSFPTETTVTIGGVTVNPNWIQKDFLWFNVPEGATLGLTPIVVTTPDGSASVPQQFNVVAGGPPIFNSWFNGDSHETGDTVVLKGSNFCFLQCSASSPITETTITIGGITITPINISIDSLIFVVPENAAGGTAPIRITAPGGYVDTPDFTVIIPTAPIIDRLSRTRGIPGDLVEVWGSNFCKNQCNTSNSTETWVLIGGSAFPISWVEPDYMHFRIPEDASGTGKIGVFNFTLGEMGWSAKDFEVIPGPVITSFTPTISPVGTEVTINGDNLCIDHCGDPSAEETTVIVGGAVITQPVTLTKTSVTVMLPPWASGTTAIGVHNTISKKLVWSTESFTVISAPVVGLPYPNNLDYIRIGEGSSFNGANFCYLQCMWDRNYDITETRMVINGVDAKIMLLTSDTILFEISSGTPTGAISSKIIGPGGSTDAPVFNVIR